MAKFKTRARALDMLGRQQITGIPNAINELFKNAHDAYADIAIVDYFRKEDLFILRDDGFGMTKMDFENRWLTLGTESKISSNKTQIPEKYPNKKVRPIMGEKGIGRLAIATIGKQVLILTRAMRDEKPQNLVAAFINWSLFEIPGLDLDQVVIPVKEFNESNLPNSSDITNMVNEVKVNVEDLFDNGHIDLIQKDLLINLLEKFVVDPLDLDSLMTTPSLANGGCGTHFYITPVDEMMNVNIDGSDLFKEKATPLTKSLLGFTNTMTPNAPEPNIEVSFRDHKTDDFVEDLIKKDEFFTPQEFNLADHHIDGNFDEYGQFKGDIKVYGEEFKNHKITWTGNKGLFTLCGPFSINIAYVQGERFGTKLDLDDYNLIDSKLKKYSGLYIYKDGIRVLPYGDSDYDFVDIERNRNKSASYYFFSYRRMYGIIDIKKQYNNNLIEKAGREGFSENKAYKQFQEILKNFFLQLAADFFREQNKGGGAKAFYWENKKVELERLFRAKEEQEKRTKTKKLKFKQELDSFFNNVSNQSIQLKLSEILVFAEQSLKSAANLRDPDAASEELIKAESLSRKKFLELRQQCKINKPLGFALGKQLTYEWEAYLEKYKTFEDDFFRQSEQQLFDLINLHSENFNKEIIRRRRLENAIVLSITEHRKITTNGTSETIEIAKKLDEKINLFVHELRIKFKDKEEEVKSNLAKIHPNNLTDDNLVSERTSMEDKIIEVSDYIKKTLGNIQFQLQNVNVSDDVSSVELTEALEQELDSLRERVESDLELNQLGLAVSVIQHEFHYTTKSIRDQIRRLKAWADVNEGISEIYNNISSNFDHLDGYLNLFTPLNRRMHRKEIDIYGNDIHSFLKDFFSERLKKERHDIDLGKTSDFSKLHLKGFPSTFYPVFVNIVDNAIFWLKDQNGERKILLDSD